MSERDISINPEFSSPVQEKGLSHELSASLDNYLHYYLQRIGHLEDSSQRLEHARQITTEATDRNNKMSEIMESEEFSDVDKEIQEILGDCKIGAITCMDGRIPLALVFGPGVDVSKQKAGILPTDRSADTGLIVIDSSTVRQAVIESPMKEDNPVLLEFLVAHVSHGENGFESNCAAAELIKEELINQGEDPGNDLILINLNAQKPGLEAVERTYNASAKKNGKPELKKAAVRIAYDTNSMGFLLGYGEEKKLFTTDLTKEFSEVLKSKSEQDPEFPEIGSRREFFSSLDSYVKNEKMYLKVVKELLNNKNFSSKIDNLCEGDVGEICGLNESQKRGLKYILARNVAFQYLTNVHNKEFSARHPFVAHAEKYMTLSLDDGHGMLVGGMDPESQSFSAVASRFRNAVEHINTMYSLMEHHESPKPRVLFVCRGIQDDVSGNSGAMDSVSADLDRTYKEIQKNEGVEELVKNGDLVMIPVILSSKNGKILKILESPLI